MNAQEELAQVSQELESQVAEDEQTVDTPVEQPAMQTPEGEKLAEPATGDVDDAGIGGGSKDEQVKPEIPDVDTTAFDALGKNIETMQDRAATATSPEEIQRIKQELSGLQNLHQKWGNEIGELRRVKQQLEQNGYIDSGNYQENQYNPGATQQSVSPEFQSIQQELQSLKQMIGQQKSEETAFNEARQFQLRYPEFQTKADIAEIYRTPNHPERDKFDKMVALDTMRQTEGLQKLSYDEVYALHKHRVGLTKKEVREAEQRGRTQTLAAIKENQENAPTLLGATQDAGNENNSVLSRFKTDADIRNAGIDDINAAVAEMERLIMSEAG